MEQEQYSLIAELQKDHWWFRARRRIVQKILTGLAIPKDAKILEIGCGMGGNLSTLAEFGELRGSDMNAEAIAYSSALGVAKEISFGELPNKPPFPEMQFDVICLLDVLEHVEDDVAALKVLYSMLKDGGYLVITVPAFKFLWSEHDVSMHHFRRYTKPGLLKVLKTQPGNLQYISYFNFFLFPPIALVRLVKQFIYGRKNYRPDLQKTSGLINRLLYGLFASESWLMPAISLPFGVSLVAILKK